MIHAVPSAIQALPTRVAGKLLWAQGSRFGDRVFLCRRGRRHWVTDARWLDENGFRWPDDVTDVDADVLEAFLPGQSAARRWTVADWQNPPADSTIGMRELAASGLRGSGYEIGAGASPFPIPLDCKIRYIDMYEEAALTARAYEGQAASDFVAPDIHASFDDLAALPDASADFLVACHVIEHTRSPMRSIHDAYCKLRPGGQIVLVVPDMTRTFDRERDMTPLSHHIDDFHRPDRERDAEHFREFYSKAFVTPPEQFEQVWRANWEEAFPIHYHTWTHAAFAEMVGYLSDNICRFDQVWSHPVLAHPESNEFYFVLQKPV